MAVLTAIAVTALVAGTALAFKAQQDSAKASKKSSKEQQRLARNTARRDRLRSIREARIRKGESLNAAAALDADESSSSAGGLSGIAAQGGANIAFSAGTERIQNNIFQAQRQGAKAAQLGAIGQGISSLGGAALSFTGGTGDVKPTKTKGFDPRLIGGGR